MVYDNLNFSGVVKKVFPPQQVTTSMNLGLVSPSEVYATRVNIQQGTGSSISLELFGIVGSEYVGKPIEVVLGYSKPGDNLRRFTQEVTLDGKLGFNADVVKRV